MDPADPPPGVLAEFLATRDAPCPRCGYNLRGLSASRCPECNTEIQLGILRPDRPDRRMWMLMLLAGVAGTLRGLMGVSNYLWEELDSWQGSVPTRYQVQRHVYLAIFILLLIGAGLGTRGLWRHRGDESAGLWARRLLTFLLGYWVLTFVVATVFTLATWMGF